MTGGGWVGSAGGGELAVREWVAKSEFRNGHLALPEWSSRQMSRSAVAVLGLRLMTADRVLLKLDRDFIVDATV